MPGKKSNSDRKKEPTEYEIDKGDFSLLYDANQEVSKLEEAYGTLIAGFMTSPLIKEAQKQVEIATLAFQKIGSYVLKKHGLDGLEALNWQVDFKTGKIKKVKAD